MLLLLYSQTIGRLGYSIAMVAFVLTGTNLEEKGILEKFPEYKDFMKQVPFKILPDISKLCPHAKSD
jgi:protein-S-isoprenylcysteine O-methyltransferase Ste14